MSITNYCSLPGKRRLSWKKLSLLPWKLPLIPRQQLPREPPSSSLEVSVEVVVAYSRVTEVTTEVSMVILRY